MASPSPSCSADTCAWCRRELAGQLVHRQRRTCSQRCRQSLWRFERQVQRLAAADRPMRFAYADPPYPKLSRYYKVHPDYAGEVDHEALLCDLVAGGFDGWALSTSAKALPGLLAFCVRDLAVEVSVAAWVRGARPGEALGPRSAWEPVVLAGGRRVRGPQPADALAFAAKPRTSDPDRVIGAKPAAFASWLFQLLGARAGDELVDLYPGSGGIGRAWEAAEVSPHGQQDW